MKAKIIALFVTALLFLSIYVFLSVDFKELQNEPILTIVAYYAGMIVCLPAMIFTPLMPDSLSVLYSNIAVGTVGVVVSIFIGLLFYRILNKKP
jgi:uncharacterized membrane-anchored protein